MLPVTFVDNTHIKRLIVNEETDAGWGNRIPWMLTASPSQSFPWKPPSYVNRALPRKCGPKRRSPLRQASVPSLRLRAIPSATGSTVVVIDV